MKNEQTGQKPDLEIFVIFDSKTSSYREPMLNTNEATMLRELSTIMKDPNIRHTNQYVTNAEDFSLFKIGSYNKSTGAITPINAQHIVNLHDLRAAAQN